MKRFALVFKSSIGKKFIAAITGLILFGFLIGHMAGNLKVFTGSTEAGVPHIDEYGHALRELGSPFVPREFVLWGARTVLLVSLVFHIVVVIQLARQSAAARPLPYVRNRQRAASLPARWMMYSGMLILAFVIFHILHFTTGTIKLGTFEHGYIYSNLHSSFSKLPVAAIYIAMMIALGFHMFHGVWSLFQTLGLDNPDRNRALRWFAISATLVIALGFVMVPVSFVLGIMPDPVEYAVQLLNEK
ncbi:MAG TPA: succinate dehydrogenase cytochrome b subunit [Pirellulaceae bacterium]|nr:succinate dehydrogenase cytochrome b subunit [Pirellulaceae bacterium]HMO93750.1 succinate dehydrogenase cytochrome b subunit [Pirellulaceae bacterium]HMP69913.1 succinate dehydrogenase cytochrome b subunit [Pirellulaceae bacterium]